MVVIIGISHVPKRVGHWDSNKPDKWFCLYCGRTFTGSEYTSGNCPVRKNDNTMFGAKPKFISKNGKKIRIR